MENSNSGKLGKSDYETMGMGQANLYQLYSGFQVVFSLPGIIGACIALFVTKSQNPRAKLANIVAADAGPLYLSWAFGKLISTWVAANLGTARRLSGCNAPDQHVYKVTGGPADGSTVLMDDAHPLHGPFNRAQRGLGLLVENSTTFAMDFLLAGYVFPVVTSLCASGYYLARFKSARDYTDDRTKRLSGFQAAGLAQGGLAGIIWAVGLYATGRLLKK